MALNAKFGSIFFVHKGTTMTIMSVFPGSTVYRMLKHCPFNESSKCSDLQNLTCRRKLPKLKQAGLKKHDNLYCCLSGLESFSFLVIVDPHFDLGQSLLHLVHSRRSHPDLLEGGRNSDLLEVRQTKIDCKT